MEKNETIAKEFEFLGQFYYVSKHIGSNTIKFKRLEKDFWGNTKYKQIYSGHINPLEEVVKFFNTNPPTQL